MTLETFTASVTHGEEPPDLTPALRALWLDGRGDWSAAHELANEIAPPDGARIHAYLHRKEGDLDNARYWYRQAGRPPFEGNLAEEWSTLARDLLGRAAVAPR